MFQNQNILYALWHFRFSYPEKHSYLNFHTNVLYVFLYKVLSLLSLEAE